LGDTVKSTVNLAAAQGVAVREYQTDIGPADYVLFVDRKPVDYEARRKRKGHRLTVVEEQSSEYANKTTSITIRYHSCMKLQVITRFTDYRDPKPRGRNVFHFHQPGTIAEWLKKAIVLEHVYRTLSLR
jgi:type I restriction enzyme R subunit